MQKDFLTITPSITTALDIFDHTFKTIILYGSELWGFFDPSTFKFKRNIKLLDKIYPNPEGENLLIRFINIC